MQWVRIVVLAGGCETGTIDNRVRVGEAETTVLIHNTCVTNSISKKKTRTQSALIDQIYAS